MNLLVSSFKKTFVFNGRAQRREIFYFFLALISYFMIGSVLTNVFAALEATFLISYYLLFGIPLISLSVRRAHDSGKSGFWLLLIFIPLIGFLLYLFLIPKSNDCLTEREMVLKIPEL